MGFVGAAALAAWVATAASPRPEADGSAPGAPLKAGETWEAAAGAVAAATGGDVGTMLLVVWESGSEGEGEQEGERSLAARAASISRSLASMRSYSLRSRACGTTHVQNTGHVRVGKASVYHAHQTYSASAYASKPCTPHHARKTSHDGFKSNQEEDARGTELPRS